MNKKETILRHVNKNVTIVYTLAMERKNKTFVADNSANLANLWLNFILYALIAVFFIHPSASSAQKGASITDTQALELGVINVIASNVPDLLSKINGLNVNVQGNSFRLDTSNLTVVSAEPNWKTEFLMIITDPNIAYVLLLIGIYGLFFEFISPGMVAPGVIGVISLLVGLYGLQLLPISYVGLGLILLGITFMVAELFLPSFGSLGIGGVIAFAVGSVMLFNKETTGYALPWSLILSVTLLSALSFIFIGTLALRARKQPQITGHAATVGQIGYATESFTETGWVMVDGERWQAETTHPIHKGQKVYIKSAKGLVLTVEGVRDKR